MPAAESQRIGGFRTMLGVPLLREGVPIGVIALTRTTVRPFTEKQIELVETFADQAVIAIENVRLFDEVQARTAELSESLEYQTATADVLSVISRSPTELQPVLDTIAETAGRLCEAYDVLIRLRDGDLLKVAAHRGPISVDSAAMPIGRGWAMGRAVADRAPVHVHDLWAAADEFPDGQALARRLGARTLLATPLIRENHAIGAIAVRRAEVRPFSEKQIALLQTFADQAVIAINNARLFDEVQARTRELQESLEFQTATSDVLNVISRSPNDIQPVLDAIVETAARLCRGDFAIVWKLEADRYRVAALNRDTTPELAEYARSNPIGAGRGTLVGRVASGRATVHIPDVTLDAEYQWADGRWAGHLRTMLGVPLLREGVVIGVIAIHRRTAQPFSPREIELVTTFADQAVIAINNVGLFDEVQARTRELSEALEQQTATSEVLQVINASPGNLAPVFEAMLAKATQLCNAKLGIMWTYNGEAFTIAAERGTPRPSTVFGNMPLRPGPATALGRVQREKRVLHVPDMMDEEAYRAGDPLRVASVTGLGMRSWLGVPLLKEGKLLGVFTIYRGEVRPFSDKEIALVTSFAEQAVIAIENVRLFDEVQARTAEVTETLEQQTATSEVLKVISSSLTDTQPVFDAIVQSGRKLFSNAAISIALPDGDRVRAAAVVDSDPARADAWRRVFPFPLTRDYMHGLAILDRRVVDVPDIENAPEELAVGIRNFARSGYRAVTIMPMLRGDAAIGALSVVRVAPGPLSEKQLATLRTFANQAVIAIENTRLLSELRSRTDELARSVSELQALGRGQPGGQLDARPRDGAVDDRGESGAAVGDRCRRDLRLQQAAPEVPPARHLRHERRADRGDRPAEHRPRRVLISAARRSAASRCRCPTSKTSRRPRCATSCSMPATAASSSCRCCGRTASSAPSSFAARSRACSRNRPSTCCRPSRRSPCSRSRTRACSARSRRRAARSRSRAATSRSSSPT